MERKTKWISPSDCLRKYIHESFQSINEFVDAFNADEIVSTAGLSISRSLVDSWLCARRKIWRSSADVIWHVARILTHNGTETDMYKCIGSLIHGQCHFEEEE